MALHSAGPIWQIYSAQRSRQFTAARLFRHWWGSAILQIMIDAARRLGVVFIDQLSAYKLLTENGRVTGAAFCDTVGTPSRIAASAVVLCAGGATGLFPRLAVTPA